MSTECHAGALNGVVSFDPHKNLQRRELSLAQGIYEGTESR